MSMLMGRLPTPPVYRLRPSAGSDSYGDPVESWANPQRTLLPRAQVQVPTSTLPESLQTDRVLHVPGTADVTARDRIEYDGAIWRIEGTPIVRRGLASGVYTTAPLSLVQLKEA